MPLYEYLCPDCQTQFDSLRSMSKADDPIACPNCAGDSASRRLSRFAAFSSSEGGTSRSVAGSGSCATCTSGSCATCSHG